MNLTFKTKKLQKVANNDKKMVKDLGPKRAKIFRRRLTQLHDSGTLEDLRYQPGHFHELKGDRKGEWACDLDHPYRLIFTPHEDPIPQNDQGVYIWAEIKGVEIIEIKDYH